MNKITTTSLKEKIEREDIVIVDVRTENEYREVHIKNSVNIPLDKIEQIKDSILKSKREIVFVCKSGIRSKKACKQISTDKKNIYYLDGFPDENLLVSGSSSWGVERQVRLVAGTLVFIGSSLGFLNSFFYAIPILVGLGLMFAAISNTCMMGSVLMKLPYNRTKHFSKKRITSLLQK